MRLLRLAVEKQRWDLAAHTIVLATARLLNNVTQGKSTGRGDKWILHHQSGPMESQQLQQEYLRFKLDNVPKSFIFLEATTMDNNVIQYSRGEMHSFMERSLENCVSHMEEFNRIWERCL